ncbi:Uncharacterized protein FKW44_015424, partial [Caligus rogercresseyi]
RTVPNAPDGTFDLDKAETLIRSEDVHYPVSRVLVIENTHNKAGGKKKLINWFKYMALNSTAMPRESLMHPYP